MTSRVWLFTFHEEQYSAAFRNQHISTLSHKSTLSFSDDTHNIIPSSYKYFRRIEIPKDFNRELHDSKHDKCCCKRKATAQIEQIASNIRHLWSCSLFSVQAIIAMHSTRVENFLLRIRQHSIMKYADRLCFNFHSSNRPSHTETTFSRCSVCFKLPLRTRRGLSVEHNLLQR